MLLFADDLTENTIKLILPRSIHKSHCNGKHHQKVNWLSHIWRIIKVERRRREIIAKINSWARHFYYMMLINSFSLRHNCSFRWFRWFAGNRICISLCILSPFHTHIQAILSHSAWMSSKIPLFNIIAIKYLCLWYNGFTCHKRIHTTCSMLGINNAHIVNGMNVNVFTVKLCKFY